jgi:hypothetical protein
MATEKEIKDWGNDRLNNALYFNNFAKRVALLSNL